MLIISGGRGIGKTKMLLEQAAATGGTIVCSDPNKMRERAHKYGIVGLNIIGYGDLNEEREENTYIHDINSFLESKFGMIAVSVCNIFFQVETGRYRYEGTFDHDMSIVEFEEFQQQYSNVRFEDGVWKWEDKQ